MNSLSDMVWIEQRKAIRSRMPLWSVLASLLVPAGLDFLNMVAKHPEISQKLGLVSAKADLVAYAGTDWAAYLGFYGLAVAAVGLIFFAFVVSWIFGREFADGTVKDLLAVPVPRASILLAKFFVAAVWMLGLTAVILLAGLAMGAALGLPGGSAAVIADGGALVLVTAVLSIVAITPFAWLAGVGRGYLLPLGAAILTLMAANLVAIVGWGDYFPWAVPGFYAQAKGALAPASYVVVALTGLAGMAATYLWWKHADQNR